MAIVYRALDQKTGREVAVKLLRPEFERDEEFVRRFSHEAKAAAQVAHENIVNMLDVGFDGVPYIVMEFVRGQTLKDLIRSVGSIPPRQAVAMRCASWRRSTTRTGTTSCTAISSRKTSWWTRMA